MRILFLVTRDWTHPQATGGDACTCDYARYLASRGREVTLLAARYPGSAPEELLEGLRIVRPAGTFLLALWAFAYYIRHRAEFDLVFEEGMASFRIPFLAPLYVRRPLVAIWYQINQRIFAEQYPRPLAWLLTWAERLVLALHRCCLLLALSEERRLELLALGFPPEQVRVVPPPMLDSRPAAAAAQREPLVVWLGKIRRYKCPHHAIEAMAEVVRHVPDVRLVIAGRRDDEKYETELLALAERLGIGGRVTIETDLSDDEKWELLARAQALVVTSPVEGFGIVVVEANQCGTPAVATEGTPSAVVRAGYNGLRVPFGDRGALASALVRVLTDRALFDALSRSAREHAAQFSPDETGRRLEESFVAAIRRAA